MKQILIVAQVIPQWYVDTLTEAFGEKAKIDIITGSDVGGNVIPSPQYDPTSFKSRLICWWRHYQFMTSWMKKNTDKHYDVIFAISNPPINSYIGLKLKKQFQAPFFYMNWDLYPQCIEYMIKSPGVKLVCRLWHHWNSRNYPKIDCMLTIGDVVAESINRDLKNKIQIHVIPIATDTEKLSPVAKTENPFCIKYSLTDKFVVIYSGKMGYGHNIEVILKAAEALQEQQQIQFVFIGEGPKYQVVQDFICKHGTKNILLLPLQPEETFPLSMACGDIGIVSQEAAMAHLFMPSKTYSMMACGMAIVGICSEHDDLQQMIETMQIGTCVYGKPDTKLEDVILDLYHDRDKLQKMQNRALQAARERYSKNMVVEAYRQLFQKYLEYEGEPNEVCN